MAQIDLQKAKMGKNDEFYTMYEDIQREVNAYLEYDPNVFKDKTVLLPCDDPEWSNFTKYFAANFERLGLKKLISTSFATESKMSYCGIQLSFDDFLTDYEKTSPQYDETLSNTKGKIFTLSRKSKKKVDIDALEWKYLDGSGDFRSDEVKALRDEADIIVTNPPFSLFREFVAWLFETPKQFLIIGNQNAITYKEIFPLIMENKMWIGCRFNQRINGENMKFRVPDSYPMTGTEVETDSNGIKYISVAGTGWFTNLDHGRRHQPLELMTMKDNLKYNKELLTKLKKDYNTNTYPVYDNYDALEVPVTMGIPSDYDGVMGVPISFLPKYCPEQFEIIGSDAYDGTPPTKKYSNKVKVVNGERMKSLTGTMGCVIKTEDYGSGTYFDVGYPVKAVYKRLFIRRKGGTQ